jgi:hypothetical protein
MTDRSDLGLRLLDCQEHVQCGFDFVTAPLVNPDFKWPQGSPCQVQLPYRRPDVLLTSAQWSNQVLSLHLLSPEPAISLKIRTTGYTYFVIKASCIITYLGVAAAQVVGKLSEWIQPDAAGEPLRGNSATALRQELEWASHLSLQACVLRLPPGASHANLARIVNQAR